MIAATGRRVVVGWAGQHRWGGEWNNGGMHILKTKSCTERRLKQLRAAFDVRKFRAKAFHLTLANLQYHTIHATEVKLSNPRTLRLVFSSGSILGVSPPPHEATAPLSNKSVSRVLGKHLGVEGEQDLGPGELGVDL